jgi:hypothetical protein
MKSNGAIPSGSARKSTREGRFQRIPIPQVNADVLYTK